MDIIFNTVCVVVTAAFALALVPGFRQPERSLLSRRDQGTALLVFLVLGLVEEATVSHAGWFHERPVAVCAAGLRTCFLWRALQDPCTGAVTPAAARIVRVLV